MHKLVAIESLRGWMAWWVVFGHGLHLAGADQLLPPVVMKIIADGDVAVKVFVIVSGFVITHLVVMRRELYLSYLLRRAFRLYPIYLVCLLLAIATADLYASAYTGSSWNRLPEERAERLLEQEEHFPEHLALHLTMLHGVVPDDVLPFSSSSILPPAWSLSLEWQFYIVAPLIILLLTLDARLAVLACAAMLSIHLAALSGAFGVWREPAFLPLSLQYFMLGILSRLVLGQGNLSRSPPPLLLALGVGAFLLIGAREALIWSMFYAFVLLETGRIKLPLLANLAAVVALNPLLATIGRWSYSTYLVHVPIFAAVVGGAEAYLGVSSQSASFVLIALCMPIVLAASKLLYLFVEAPFIKIGRRLTERRPEPA